jgi:hypothetical protein
VAFDHFCVSYETHLFGAPGAKELCDQASPLRGGLEGLSIFYIFLGISVFGFGVPPKVVREKAAIRGQVQLETEG